MSDPLSISNLLSRLQVDRKHQAIQLALGSERLVRQRCYDEALKTAASAVRLARNDYTLLGVTLLYQSYARLASHQPRFEQLAVRDCDRAVRNLSLTPFNQAIAQLIRGQVELRCKDHDCQAAALPYFNQAAALLRKLAQDEHEHNRMPQAEYCRNLLTLVNERIAELSREITTAPPIEIAEKQEAPVPPPAPEAPAPIPLPIPTRLVWPVPEPAVNLELLVEQGIVPEYVGVSEMLIQRRPYKVDPLTPSAVLPGPLHLRAQQPYLVMPLLDSARRQSVLVRQQPRPDQDRQIVVVLDPTTQTVWIDQSESAEPYTHIYIIGAERDWIFDESETPPIIVGTLRIIGIVEAILHADGLSAP